MDVDPVNCDVPAPRYELESGSEDDLEYEAGREAVTRTTQKPFGIATTDGSISTGALEHGTQLVVLIGDAGVAFLSSVHSAAPPQQFSLQTETEEYAAIGAISSASGTKITAALVVPPHRLRSSRFHEIAQTLIEAAKPSSIVIVDSYSPQEHLYRDTYSDGVEEPADADTAIRYLATPSYLAKTKAGMRRMVPLRAPEAATGLGAAFLSQAVVSNVPAILMLLEDVSFQSHVQLYGSFGAVRLSPAASDTLRTLTGLNGKHSSTQMSPTKVSTILDFGASRRLKLSAHLAVLGDGNMYI